jgi:hypothetical protein
MSETMKLPTEEELDALRERYADNSEVATRGRIESPILAIHEIHKLAKSGREAADTFLTPAKPEGG